MEDIRSEAEAARARLISVGPRKLRLRHIARQAQLITRASEAVYSASLRNIFTGLHTSFVDSLMQHAHLGTSRLMTDSEDSEDDFNPEGLDAGWMQLGTAASAVEVHYLVQVPGKVRAAFDRMSPKLVHDTRKISTLMGISPTEQGISTEVAAAREANIQLVERAGRAYAKDVRRVFSDPKNADLSTDALRSLLMQRGNVSISRADLIARDQVLKLSSVMNRVRQLNVGIEDYDWSGVMDTRERDTHIEMEGRVCSWSEPPQPLGLHPGEDFECRCIGIARIED